MKVELDRQHETLVAEAVARGHAADASAYVQALIDEAARDGWIEENREAIAVRLRERAAGPFEAAPESVEALREQLQNPEVSRESTCGSGDRGAG